MDKWTHGGHIGTCRAHGEHMETWRHGELMYTWRRHGDMEIWTHGEMDTCRTQGNWKATFLVTWRLAHAGPCGGRLFVKPHVLIIANKSKFTLPFYSASQFSQQTKAHTNLTQYCDVLNIFVFCLTNILQMPPSK